jgi:FkbM family methyltransferase
MIRHLSGSLLRLLPRNTTLPVLSGPLKGTRWIMHSGVHAYWRGVYEPELTGRIQEIVKPGMTCYDCGANVGYFTLLFSQLVGDRGQVFSFEPLPANAGYLRKHLDINKRSNVTIIEGALADYNGKARFSPDGSASSLGPGGSIEVDCRSVDSLALPPPDVMKIDVEGAEELLVKGAEQTILRHRPAILMSLHISIPAAQDLGHHLTFLGYKVTFSESTYDLFAVRIDAGQRE